MMCFSFAPQCRNHAILAHGGTHTKVDRHNSSALLCFKKPLRPTLASRSDLLIACCRIRPIGSVSRNTGTSAFHSVPLKCNKAVHKYQARGNATLTLISDVGEMAKISGEEENIV